MSACDVAGRPLTPPMVASAARRGLTVVCAGLQRSGSTWQFNVVRMLAAEVGRSCYGAWVVDYDAARPEDVHVVKTHNPAVPVARGIVLTCYRDIRDVVASYRRMGWFGAADSTDRFVETYIAALSVWRREAAHVMRYEDMKADPAAEIGRLAAVLGFAVPAAGWETVRRRVEELKPVAGEDAAFDPRTQLHRGHIGDGSAPLPAAERRHLEERYAGWLRDHGYAAPEAGWGPARWLASLRIARRTLQISRRRRRASRS